MLVLRRKEGQWVEITHRTGDRIRVRVYNIRGRFSGQLDMAFADPDHQFVIERCERSRRARSGKRGVPLPPWAVYSSSFSRAASLLHSRSRARRRRPRRHPISPRT